MTRLSAGLVLCSAIVLGVLIGTGNGAIALVLVIMVAAFFGFLINPAVFVVAYAASRPAVEPFVFSTVGPFSIGQLWGAGLVASLGAYLVLTVGRRSAGSGRIPLAWFVPLGFIALYALMTIWRPDQALAIQSVLKLTSWMLLVVVAADVASTSNGRNALAIAGLLAAVILAAVIAYAIATNQYGAAYYAGEFTDVGQGPHGLSSTAVMLSPLLFICVVENRYRRVAAVLIGLLAVGIVLSYVRTSFIGFLIVVAGYLVVAARGRSARQIGLGLGALAAMALVVYNVQGQVLGRLSDLNFLSSGSGAEMWAGGGRVGIWLTLIAEATKTPFGFVLGQGAGQSYALVYAAMGANVWAHNDYIEFLITGGVILTVGYLGMIGWFFRQSSAKIGVSDEWDAVRSIAVAAVAAYAFMAFFNGMAFYQASVFFSLVIAYVMGLRNEIAALGGEGVPE